MGTVDKPLSFKIKLFAAYGVHKIFWDFDGNGVFDYESTSETATYSYKTPGTYRAKVRIVDKHDNIVETSTVVLIKNPSVQGQNDVFFNYVIQPETSSY